MNKKEFLSLYGAFPVTLLGTIEGVTFFQNPHTKFVCWVELQLSAKNYTVFSIEDLIKMTMFNGNEFDKLDKSIQITVNYLNELNELQGEIYIEESGLIQ